jgi:heme-degrading monooxygenase HmoA
MIEVVMTHDFLPGADPKVWEEFSRKAVGQVLNAPGLVELRASRNMLGGAQVRTTTVWRTLADWAKFAEDAGYRSLEAEMRSMATNIQVEVWGPSPVVPEPLRP